MVQWKGRRASDQIEDRRGMRTPGKVAIGGVGGVLLILAISWLDRRRPPRRGAGRRRRPADGVGPRRRSPALRRSRTSRPASSPSSSPTPRTPGRSCCQPSARATRSRHWCSSMAPHSRPAGSPRLPSDRSTALPTARSTSTCRSSASSTRASARRGTSPAPTSSHTRSGTTCRTCSASPTRSRAANPRLARAAPPTTSRCASSCRPTALPASAATTQQQRHLLEPGDVEEGLRAAAAIGDDRLQRQAQGTVIPDSFTHGTSEQRVSWLRRGLESGDPAVCDTFGSADL